MLTTWYLTVVILTYNRTSSYTLEYKDRARCIAAATFHKNELMKEENGRYVVHCTDSGIVRK